MYGKKFFFALVILLLIWKSIYEINILSPLIIASPSEVYTSLFIDGAWYTLLIDLVSTLWRATVGFLIGAVLGCIFGALLYKWRILYNIAEVPLEILRSIPAIILLPFFYIAFGETGNILTISLVVWATFFLFSLISYHALDEIRKDRRMAARSIGLSGWKKWRYVLMPDALGDVIGAVRSVIGVALVVELVTEMLTWHTPGLGYRAWTSSRMYDIPMMYASIITVGLLGYTLSAGFARLDEWLIHWHGR